MLRFGPDALFRHVGDSAIVSLTATAHSVPGTSRQVVLIDGKHRLVTDEPVCLGGDGFGPAPHELLPAALAACISLTLGTYAKAKSWDLGEIAVHVEYDNKSIPRSFDITITVSADIDEARHVRLTKVAAACPLRRALETGFVFRERLLAQQPA